MGPRAQVAQELTPRLVRLSAAGLNRGVVRQTEVGTCGRLLVRREWEAEVATAG